MNLRTNKEIGPYISIFEDNNKEIALYISIYQDNNKEIGP